MSVNSVDTRAIEINPSSIVEMKCIKSENFLIVVIPGSSSSAIVSIKNCVHTPV